jgi:endonuclease/exonuclease/phosphatase family metal-dependent hydrolase
MDFKQGDAMSTIVSKILGGTLLSVASLGMAAEIDVMTQNQYLGADLTPVFDAATAVPFDPGAFNAAVVLTLQKVAATRPAERARALADEIAQRKPDVVGLQEAYKFDCMPLSASQPLGENCDHPALKGAFTDHLTDTLAALGGRYDLAGKVTELNIALPNGIPFTTDGINYAMLGLADRDAILVRRGIPAAPVVVPGCRVSDQGCNYYNGTFGPPTLTLGTLTIAVERGYLAVDVTVRKKGYRIFNTHLEQRLLAPSQPATRLLQVLQAQELMQASLTPVDRKVIVVGDFNSDPRDTITEPAGVPTPYQIFTALGGFTDAWMTSRRPHNGFTCCQSEALTNRKSELYERIDMIFSLTLPRHVREMKLLGDTIGDKTRPPGYGGLWPSDHAALAAELDFE